MEKKAIEAIYPLTPLQEGMLFHSLREPDAAAYFQQLSCTIEGSLDTPAFRLAWEHVASRHTALRTIFAWEGTERPLQIVLRQVSLPWTELDWRSLVAPEQAARLDAMLVEDRRRGFDLTVSPLMRFTLARVEDRRWRFVWSHHHLLLDGWSVGPIFRDQFDAYRALRAGRSPELPFARPFKDFVTWLGQQDLGRAEAFWRDALRGITAPTPLAVDGPRTLAPGEESYDQRELALSPELTDALRALGREHKLTLCTLTQGAWALLLHRYSGERDVVFGVTVSGRPPTLEDTDSRVGMFINTLPLRVHVPRGSALEWLASLQKQFAAIREVEYSPLIRIREWSELPPGAPLFESILVFENYPLQATALAGEDLALRDVRALERSSYPLSLIAEPGEALTLRMLFDRRRFTADAVERMLGQLETLLRGMTEIGSRPISALSLLTPAEHERTIGGWNDTRRPYARDQLMHELFERAVERTPDAPAVFFEGSTLTYRALEERANRLAAHLQALGFRRGDFVGVHLGRSADMVVAVLGILKSGCAYVPFEKTFPLARIRSILDRLEIRGVVSDATCAPALLGLEQARALQHVVVLGREHARLRAEGPSAGAAAAPWRGVRVSTQDEIDARPAVRVPSGVRADDLAYVIFTSGSTGTPKGVVVVHRPVINLIEWVNGRFAVGPRDRLLFTTSLCFDLSVYDIFGILAAGGLVHVASERDLEDPEQLARLLRREPITFWDSAPAALQQLVAFLPEGREESAQLRLVFLSGDWVPLSLPGRIKGVFPRAEVIALGGATEATVWSNYFPVQELAPDWSSVPYGRPISNARYYILDPDLEPCPVGVPGDLFIGGECLSSGYARDPVQTADRFMPDPYGWTPGARMYRTGDRARFWADGTMEFLGRLDAQVKVRGFRIELGEIESALARHPGVREAVVLAHGEARGDKRLVAFVVPAPGATVAADTLKQHLGATLPGYMVPQAILAVDALPVTANGKLDRAALLALEAARGPASRAARPRTAVQELLASLWSEALKREVPGIHDDFFSDLGGHSLSATQLIARARKAFGLEIPLRSIFESPTIAGLAEAIERLRDAARADGPPPPITPVPRHGGVPLSFAQQRLWFLDQLEPGNPFYNLSLAARLSGKVARPVLERSIAAIVDRHEALRTVFIGRDQLTLQVAAAAWPVALPVVDLTGEDPAERPRRAERIALEEARRPFELARGPLFRGLLIALGPEEHILLLTMHHIVSDGWSLGVLIREVAECYAALAKGQPPQLSPLPIQYPDFAVWQRARLSPARLESKLAYWKDHLASLRPLELPADRPRPEVQRFEGRTRFFELGEALTSALQALARREGVTLFMALMGAFQALLGDLAKQDDVVVGTDIAGRDREETEGLIGFFVNQLVIRTDLGGNPSFRELLKRVRRVVLAAYEHQEVPFDKLVEALNPKRTLDRHPIFNVKLVLQNAPMPELVAPGLEVKVMELDPGTAKFDLLLTLEESDPTAGPPGEGKSEVRGEVRGERGGRVLKGALEYRTDLYQAETIEKMLVRYEALLTAVTRDPEVRLDVLGALMAEADLRRWDQRAAELALEKREKLMRLTGRPARSRSGGSD